MKRTKIFTRSLTFLIVGVLAVMAFLRGSAQIWGFAGVFAVWGVWMSIAVLRSAGKRITALRRKKRFTRADKKARTQAEQYGSYPSEEENTVSTALLRHVNYRILGYLRSAYSEVTWEWQTKEPEKLAIEGGTGRIRLFGVPDFNYADVMIDQRARIDCEMLRIIPLANVKGGAESEPEKKRDDTPVDPEVWYNIQGKKILETCVDALNQLGHASLLIKENGDVCVKQADNETVRDNFKNLPGKSVWQGLAKVIEKQGLKTSVMDDCIMVSW